MGALSKPDLLGFTTMVRGPNLPMNVALVRLYMRELPMEKLSLAPLMAFALAGKFLPFLLGTKTSMHFFHVSGILICWASFGISWSFSRGLFSMVSMSSPLGSLISSDRFLRGRGASSDSFPVWRYTSLGALDGAWMKMVFTVRAESMGIVRVRMAMVRMCRRLLIIVCSLMWKWL